MTESAQQDPTTRELARTQEEIKRNQEDIKKDQRDQWGYIHDTRNRVAASEAGIERLWNELHTFRTESREDAEASRKETREMTQEIHELGQSLGAKANHADLSRIDRVADSVNVGRGGLRLAAWIIGAGLPAGVALIAGVYYLGEIVK